MVRMKIVGISVVALTSVLLAPSARAQQASGIAGVVRDPSGAVLPGVTVEAASPALIEKVRSVTTDANGLYRIENLRPGTYTPNLRVEQRIIPLHLTVSTIEMQRPLKVSRASSWSDRK